MSDADYYQAHKDDSDEWGEPERGPKDPKRRLGSVISVRFDPDEDQALRLEAARRGLTLSALIRQSVLESTGVRPHSAFGLDQLQRETSTRVTCAVSTVIDRVLRGEVVQASLSAG